MAFKGRFIGGLLLWVVLLMIGAFGLVWSMQTQGLGAVRLVIGIFCVAALAGLWNHVRLTNVQLARFVNAIRFGDLSQNFGLEAGGSGFGEVGDALNRAIRMLREERHKLSEANRFCEAVLDDAPTALLIIDAQGRVELGNKAARRLLMKHRGVRIEDFSTYGDAFGRSLGDPSVGRARLVPLLVDSVAQTVMMSAAVVQRLGGLVRVVAIQPIQSELNEIEIAAQSDLIRVLTHEIMNSMTPVTSLAHTAAALVAKADQGGSLDISDARVAVETLAKRADGIMHFVETYRQISRSPKIRPRKFVVEPWAGEVAAMFRASGIPPNLTFDVTVEPDDLVTEADPDLLFQVLINLLGNAAEAAIEHSDKPAISLAFSPTRDGRTAIEVSDNGAGVPEALRQDVFLPFFTTKTKGTGIGLSLARQIILAHQGSIDLKTSTGGGASFRLVI
ncbi:MAG: GHKL domain-containing protein [Sphingomonas sp.]|nr:GHKL domain-containing protein [Sphingomonas sp.]